MSKQPYTKQKLSITESPSNFEDLDNMSVNELLTNINHEDAKVHLAVRTAIPQIETLIKQILVRMQKGRQTLLSRSRNQRQARGARCIRGPTFFRCP